MSRLYEIAVDKIEDETEGKAVDVMKRLIESVDGAQKAVVDAADRLSKAKDKLAKAKRMDAEELIEKHGGASFSCVTSDITFNLA